MEINLASVEENKEYTFDEDIAFPVLPNSPTLKALNNIHVKGKYTLYGDILNVQLHITGVATMICAYSLEEGEYKINTNDQLNFTLNEEDEDDELIFDSATKINLDEYIYSTIVAYLPIKYVKKGAKFPQSNANYRIITEDQYNEEKKAKKTSPFDVLDDLDL